VKKVIIIGAGPAGLTAGYELLKQSNDYEVTILEETSGIGGISRTINHNGNRMDLGGHRFFSKDERVNQWWQEMMPLQGSPSYDDAKLHRSMPLSKGGPDPEKTDRAMLLRNRVSRIYYRKKFFDYPVKMNVNTIKNMGFATTVEAGISYLGSTVKKLPEDSLENFYINRFGRKLYSMFFEGYTEKLWGRHPSKISADWGAQRVKGLSIAAVLKDMLDKAVPEKLKKNNASKKVETSLIEQFWYPKYGPGQMWEIVAAEFEKLGGTIIKNSCVKSLEKTSENKNHITRVVCEENGKSVSYDADIVISSMPVKDLVAGISNVPENVSYVAKNLPYRDFVTVGVLVNKLNLKNETKLKTLSNIVPDCWIYVQDTGVKLGRIQIFNNWSPYMVKKPENTVWIGLEYFCDEGDKFWKLSDAKWTKWASHELMKMGIINDYEEVLDSHCEHVKKAYPAYFDTYDRMDEVISYIDTFDNLYCVGRNGQHRYNNMDHSMVTSFETVKHILSGGNGDKSAIWNVNTEQEYHETSQK
jgi:protoporphyrinogen oxidase